MANMAINVPYEAIGKGFVQQYYAMFDDPAQRPNLINMYNVRRERSHSVPKVDGDPPRVLSRDSLRGFPARSRG